MFDNKVDKAE